MSNILRIPPRRTPSATSKMEIDVPQIMTINQVVAPSSEPDFEEDYVTDEEEVDEIIDDEPPPAVLKPNGKGKAKATPNNLTPNMTPAPAFDELPPPKPKEKELPPLPPRKPGETHVDQQRVEKIIKAHGDMLPPSKDAVFLISLAAEEFVKRLAETGRRYATRDQRSSIGQRDMAFAAQVERSYFFLRETVPTAIPLSFALQRHTQKENERTMIATELSQPSAAIGNGTSAHSHKKRQPPLPKPQPIPKGKTRTSARQANGRSSAAASTSSTPNANSPRPKRAAAQKGRESWAQADDDHDDPLEYEDEEPNYPPPPPPPEDDRMDVGDEVVQWRSPMRGGFGGAGAGRGGIMKGFGPGAYGKVGGLSGAASVARSSSSPGAQGHARNSWGFPPEPPRNTGRTIYSNRTDEEARKAAVDAEEQLRYKRARQKIEQELLTQDVPEVQPPPSPERTPGA